MQKIISLLMLLCWLSGCGLISIHKIDVEQGNIIAPEIMNRIHRGMTPNEVKEIMGPPILTNTFSENRLDYVYTFKAGNKRESEQTYKLIFKQDRLADIQANTYSQFGK